MEPLVLKCMPQGSRVHLMSSIISFCPPFFFHLDDMRKLLITAWRIASLLSPSQYMGFDVYIIGGISD